MLAAYPGFPWSLRRAPLPLLIRVRGRIILQSSFYGADDLETSGAARSPGAPRGAAWPKGRMRMLTRTIAVELAPTASP
jgi:hypothetical protein